MRMHAAGKAPARTWRLRASVLLGLICFLAPMATLAVASTGRPPRSAIPKTTLDRILYGQRPASKTSSKLTARPVAIPRTAAGAQLAWLLTEVNGGSATLTQTDVRAHVSASFMDGLPASKIVQLLKSATDEYGPIQIASYAGFPSAPSAIALVETRAHLELSIDIRVDGSPHHRITGLNIDPLVSKAGA